MLTKMALVAAGGAAGAVLRWLAGQGVHKLMGHGFPWGTAFVNIAGSLAMGLLAAAIAEKAGFRSLSLLLMTGLLGGFTTFSAFSLDALYLIERGRIGAATAYIGGSVILSVAALALGLWLGRAWLQ